MFKPLLAARDVDFNKLKFPILVSPKFDGIRCVMLNGKAVSRTLKPIPNYYVRDLLESHVCGWPGLDGELIVDSPTDPNCMQKTSSGIMSYDGKPNFTYYVFDFISPTDGFSIRLNDLSNFNLPPYMKFVEHTLISNVKELEAYEEDIVSAGYEGVMIRSIDGRYKFGRSTVNEGILLKLKRFVDEEAIVIGFEEKLHNANVSTIDNLGHTKRSSHQDNLVLMGTLGSLVVYSNKWGVFNVGSGFNDTQRQDIWDNQEKYLSNVLTFKYQLHGVKDKPRHPIFKCFREDI